MNKMFPFNCNYSTRHGKNWRKSNLFWHFDLSTRNHFHDKNKNKRCWARSKHLIETTQVKKYILFTSWLILEKCPACMDAKQTFFLAKQIHICYCLSISRLPLKVRKGRCRLLYKRSNVCTYYPYNIYQVNK